MHKCPQCSGEIYRIPRRLIDRVMSLFAPLHRYKCLMPYCAWEGNIAQDQKSEKQPRPA